MGQHPDQFLPCCGFLFFQYILDIFYCAQQDHLILHLEFGGIDSQLKDIILVLHLYQFVFTGIDGKKGIGQFFAQGPKFIDISADYLPGTVFLLQG